MNNPEQKFCRQYRLGSFSARAPLALLMILAITGISDTICNGEDQDKDAVTIQFYQALEGKGLDAYKKFDEVHEKLRGHMKSTNGIILDLALDSRKYPHGEPITGSISVRSDRQTNITWNVFARGTPHVIITRLDTGDKYLGGETELAQPPTLRQNPRSMVIEPNQKHRIPLRIEKYENILREGKYAIYFMLIYAGGVPGPLLSDTVEVTIGKNGGD